MRQHAHCATVRIMARRYVECLNKTVLDSAGAQHRRGFDAGGAAREHAVRQAGGKAACADRAQGVVPGRRWCGEMRVPVGTAEPGARLAGDSLTPCADEQGA